MPPTFREMVEAGFALCIITQGKKAPTYKGWPSHPVSADAAEGADGCGLLHAMSNTCCLDVDNIELARPWLAERGVDLDFLLAADERVGISSGRSGRAKLLFTVSVPLRTVMPKGSGLELRCASARGTSSQDVLPPTVHPNTGKPYTWDVGILGDWRTPPVIPVALKALWEAEAGPLPAGEDPDYSPPPPSQDVDRLRAILAKADPNGSHDEWLHMGLMCNHETQGSSVGLALWNEWASKATEKCGDGTPKYKGLSDLKVRWLTFKTEPGKRVITAASFEHTEPARADEFDAPVTVETSGLKSVPVTEQLPVNYQTGGRTGEMICNIHNAIIMIRTLAITDFIVAHDTFLDKLVVRWYGAEAFNAWTDNDTTELQKILQVNGLKVLTPAATLQAARYVANENQVDCLKDWINGLEWDHKRRLSLFMRRAFGTASDAKYNRYYMRAGRNFIISMVARALMPESQVDTMPILESAQGELKSSALRIIGAPWYSVLSASVTEKDGRQQLRGRWLGEFPELEKMSRANIGAIKEFITDRNDRYRPTWGTFEVEHPRRIVLCGSTNEDRWARDPTGGRRYMPVRVGQIDLKYLSANRDQLFAEATHLYKAGRPWHKWGVALEVWKEMLNERLALDPWEERIETDWSAAVFKAPNGRQFVTTGGILELVLAKQPSLQTPYDVSRVTNALKKLRFEHGTSQIRLNNVKMRPWYVPEEILVDPLLM